MSVLGVDFRGLVGRISIINCERVGRMVMEDEILISISHNGTQICREPLWRLWEVKKKTTLHPIQNTAKKEQHITR